MKLPHIRKTARQSIKEALDNLPVGVCFFDKSGLITLCNRQMQRLSHAITGHDLQLQSEIEAWLDVPPEHGAARDGNIFLLEDGTAWSFERKSIIADGNTEYTEFIAFNVTELYRRKLRLEEGVREQRKVIRSIENISHNIAAVTRNEEALKLKMKLHNDLGAALNFARRYLADGCPVEGRSEFTAKQRKMSQILLDESHGEEDNDPLSDLYHVAEGLGMKIEMQGGEMLNADLRRVLSYAVRECLVNTVRHADGDTVWVELGSDEKQLYCALTNNGAPPAEEIIEGGGLSSLREKMQSCGGSVRIQSLPRFRMSIILPLDAKDD